MGLRLSVLLWTLVLGWIGVQISRLVYNVFLHPLRAYPGPIGARASTWWKTYVEVLRQESMTEVLLRLHKQYGDIVRVGPNELHFSDPYVYHEIYNPNARWKKEKLLYESFGEDHSSFGLLTYGEAKQRKDVLQPMFSRRAILNMQTLVQEKMNHLSLILTKNHKAGKSSDLLFAFRCYAMDNITAFCFSKSVGALNAPDFAAPIVQAMDNSLPTFHLFHHFPLFRKAIFALPPWLAVKLSPETAGLTNLQVILGEQVHDVLANPGILKEGSHPTIYHRLLDPAAQKGKSVPDARALYDEAQTMLFAGGVTVGDTLMTGHCHILHQPPLHSQLREEVLSVWPAIDQPPSLEVLETLPLLTATVKEALRMSPGACSPLLRVVPRAGATISGRRIPGGTVVGIASVFVHRSGLLFGDAEIFRPDRWIGRDSKRLEQWLVAFSRGPRSCLGLNLAWCELYVAFATMVRRFDMRIDGTEDVLAWRDCFTPYYETHLRAWCQPVNK